jgi:hypothetical protein
MIFVRIFEVRAKYISITREVFISIATEPLSFMERMIIDTSEAVLILLARARGKTNESLASRCMRIWHET